MIRNEHVSIRKADVGSTESLATVISKLLGGNVLRWYVSEVNGDEIIVEATIYEGEVGHLRGSVVNHHYPGKSVVLSIIPTGIGCNIGGFAGDAGPVTSLLASAVDYLVTNPNAVNASDFIRLDDNVVYTEGYSIDLFCQGLVDLYLPYSNKIGLIIERSDPAALDVVFNTLNSVRATHGINVTEVIVTDAAIGGRCVQTNSGAFVGTIDHPEVLFDACEKLISKGVNAIAITTNIQDLPRDSYAKHFAGEYPNPVGGVEAVISHLVTKRFQLPAAHAPLSNMKQLELMDNVVDARGAGEMVSSSGLACVLIGLQRAPQIKAGTANRIADIINVNNLLAVVAPRSCMGGVPVLYAKSYGVPVIAVRENHTILQVTPQKVHLEEVIEVDNYAEAAGIILALKKGIDLESLSRPLRTLRPSGEKDKVSIRGREQCV